MLANLLSTVNHSMSYLSVLSPIFHLFLVLQWLSGIWFPNVIILNRSDMGPYRNDNSQSIAKNLVLSQFTSLSEVIKITDVCVSYVSGIDTPCGMLGYRSKQAAALNNNNREKMEERGDSAERLAELPLSPICPLRTCFLYTNKRLMIHVAFCTGCEHSAGECSARAYHKVTWIQQPFFAGPRTP